MAGVNVGPQPPRVSGTSGRRTFTNGFTRPHCSRQPPASGRWKLLRYASCNARDTTEIGMTQLRLANVICHDEPVIALEHAGQLLSVTKLEKRFALDGSPIHFTDQTNCFRYRVFSLGMAGLSEIAECLGQSSGPREALLDPSKCLFRPPTTNTPALVEFSVLAEDDVPRFRWGNGRGLRGHDAPLPIPDDEQAPQLSVQIAAVLGDDLTHASVQEAERATAGFTILCLWTFPSRNRVSPGWGGYRNGQLGPLLVTYNAPPDPAKWDIAIRVNGHLVVRAPGKNWKTSFAEMIALASEAADLIAGDIIASGPLARTSSDGKRALRPDDVLEAEIEGLGTLCGTLLSSGRRSRFLR